MSPYRDISSESPIPVYVLERASNNFIAKPLVLGLTDGTVYEVLAGLTSVIHSLWEPRAERCQALGLAEAKVLVAEVLAVVEMDSVIGYAYVHRACA